MVRGMAVVALSERATLEKMAAARNRVMAIAAGLILLSLAVSVFLIGSIVRPLRALTQGTQRVAAGELGQAVPADSRDELGELAKSFNAMTARLKASYEELQAWNRRLEEQVADRTRNLSETNTRLRQLLADKEAFMRTVTHDLGAPLRNIGAMAAYVMRTHRDQLSSEAIDRLRRIETNVEQEAALLADLMEVARIQTVREKIEEVDVAALLGQVRDSLSSAIEERGALLVWSDTLPRIACERNRMRQVFQNLIENALKYMGPQTSPRVEVGWKDLGEEHEFRVSDNGVGIDPEDRGPIFMIFRRGRDEWTAKVPGRGVGLAAVRQILLNHGGDIRVESEPGRGSTFVFTISKSVPSWKGAPAPTAPQKS